MKPPPFVVNRRASHGRATLRSPSAAFIVRRSGVDRELLVPQPSSLESNLQGLLQAENVVPDKETDVKRTPGRIVRDDGEE
jgi:hypothetical protein